VAKRPSTGVERECRPAPGVVDSMQTPGALLCTGRKSGGDARAERGYKQVPGGSGRRTRIGKRRYEKQ